MTRRNQGGLVVLSAKVSVGLADEVRRIADETEQTISLTIAGLLEQALADEGEDKLLLKYADAGYQDGLRRGLHQAKTKIMNSLKGDW